MPRWRFRSTTLPALVIGLVMPMTWWLILPTTGPLPVVLLGLILLIWQAITGSHRWRYLSMATIVTLLVLFGHAETGMRAWPVLINLGLAGLFAASLRPGSMPLIERIARRSEPELPASGVRYTRRVTALWCGFFVFNTLMALMTGLWGSRDIWLQYNGGISYLLTGVLMMGEWCVRRRVRRRHAHQATDTSKVVS
ncbi:hypothetical protein [Kushneria phosphatilytica]|uniref:Uncharacterized protein n=1 Tax=Kushneria phosphatilytica TaxID=657387 RepID=A0A1S1NQ55_9GAMM|nr:hypothetical protein [Kushneria phosphatilytica]OHV10554.1 hypothetical protein BH688_09175 [Kushneria phosphatilytica]QEL11873.1 hypothetical protein FY550_12495 [Kushneria phosphatilytica]